MAKISLKTSLKTREEKVPVFFEGYGILDSDKIVYQEKDVTTVLKKMDNRVMLTRKNDEYEISFCLELNKKTSGSYQFLKLNKQMSLQITTKMLEWNNQKIQFSYHLILDGVDMGDFEYCIIYEVIE